MIKLFNTLSGRKEKLLSRKSGKLDIFVCGPTVYDLAHLGHARTCIFFDALVKYLGNKKIKAFYLQNITDIDDKIINRAKELNITAKKLASDFEKTYLADMKNLKIDSVSKYARATDYIKEIIDQVQRLLKKNLAYQIADGIYYDISKFKEYGKLSKRTAALREDAVSRIDENKQKNNKGDFCLWKISKPGEPKWNSPWGQGRPGWHIEDTAITEKFFGSQYDIHGGGRDLIFPHHEAEIAQMEGISGKKPLVRHWLHTGFLTVNGEKMSKSLGNFITIQNFLKNNSARTLRFFFLKTHYRSPIDYNAENIFQAKKELERIDEFSGKLINLRPEVKNKKANNKWIAKIQNTIEKALEDDFNTPLALAGIFTLVREGNKLIDANQLTKNQAKEILKFLKEIDAFLNFIFWKDKDMKITTQIKKLAEERERYRKNQEWQKADEIRKELEKIGYKVEDTTEGPIVKKL